MQGLRGSQWKSQTITTEAKRIFFHKAPGPSEDIFASGYQVSVNVQERELFASSVCNSVILKHTLPTAPSPVWQSWLDSESTFPDTWRCLVEEKTVYLGKGISLPHTYLLWILPSGIRAEIKGQKAPAVQEWSWVCPFLIQENISLNFCPSLPVQVVGLMKENWIWLKKG